MVAKRVTHGIARTGSYSSNGSGEIFLALSTASPKYNSEYTIPDAIETSRFQKISKEKLLILAGVCIAGLLAVAVFSGLRNMRHTENYRSIELLHFCQKAQHLVIGGFSKILSKMVQDFRPNDIMTYIDRDWSEGHKFKALGFEKKGGIPSLCFKINRVTNERTLFKENEGSINIDEYYLVKTLGSIKMVKLID